MHLKTFPFAALISAASCAVVKRDSPPGCQNPGSHMCGAVVGAGLSAFPYPGGASYGESNGAAIVNGDCQELDGGAMNPQNPGFYSQFHAYGSPVDVRASYMGEDEIDGVEVTFQGQTYYQSGCNEGTTGFARGNLWRSLQTARQSNDEERTQQASLSWKNIIFSGADQISMQLEQLQRSFIAMKRSSPFIPWTSPQDYVDPLAIMMRSVLASALLGLVAQTTAYQYGIGVETFDLLQYTGAGPVTTSGSIASCLKDPTGSCGGCGTNNEVGTAYNDDFTNPQVYKTTDCPSDGCVKFDSEGKSADDIKNAATNSHVGVLTDYSNNGATMNCIAANSRVCDGVDTTSFSGSNIYNTIYAACDPSF
ncbi:hypothetical protein PRZ48_002272 [Zasmidium cellare]|uniref:Uncharacterized protein n=1 Tax=Zasmidium cellare TaxID=395010 RepID=A0ABR0F4Z3_ZASCE|nr:hypothetical protein PRZ48_002272 [Zasmidium cellare]